MLKQENKPNLKPVPIIVKSQSIVPFKKIEKKPSVKNYHSLLQHLIKKGKKNTLENIFRKSILYWGNLEYKNFDVALTEAFSKTTPYVGVKTKRRGSKNIYLPIKLSERKGKYFSAKWIITMGKSKKKKNFFEGVIEEIIDSALNKSVSVKKCEDLHKLAEESLTNKR